MSFKIVLKILLIKNLIKQKDGLKMCLVTMKYTERVAKYIKTWICQHEVFLYLPFKCPSFNLTLTFQVEK